VSGILLCIVGFLQKRRLSALLILRVFDNLILAFFGLNKIVGAKNRCGVPIQLPLEKVCGNSTQAVFMITSQIDSHVIDEIFRERIVPHLGTAETQKALKETELIYRSLCHQTPARENVGFLYRKFLSTYEFVAGSASKQTALDCIQFLNNEVSKNSALF
jgi:hypothetical protein